MTRGKLSRNGTAAISYLATTFVVGLYDTAVMGNVDPHSPQWIKDNALLLYMWLTPIIMALIGVAVTFALRGDRRGHLGVALAGVMVIVWQIEPLTTRWRYYGISHTGVCWVEAILSIIVIRYALRAYRESTVAAEKSAEQHQAVGS